MRNLLLIVFSLLFLPKVEAEQSTIYGRVAEGAGKVIGVYMYDDYITNTEKQLGVAITGDSGKFSITIDIETISWVFLRCDNLYGFVFATPGKNTETFLPAHNPDVHINSEVKYEVPITVWTTDSTDMNFLASDFNERFDAFWADSDQYMYFVVGQSALVLDSFHAEMDSHYVWVKNPYFHTWMDYGFAAMENATFQSERRTALRYLVNKPIQYHNHEYMGFFNNFFKDYVYRWSLKKQGAGIYRAINQKVSYDSAMAAMRHLPWLQNDTLRELVLLKGLTELYFVMSYDPRNVITVAQQISIASKISEHRQIARNIVSMFTKLRIGTMAPAFAGRNVKGDIVEPLSLYKGKYIYLFFYASWNVNSVNELRYMAELHKKYGKEIMFVSVSLDDDTTAWKKFMKANPKYNWLNLHYDFSSKLKEDYNLYALPVGFIIDKDGKFYAAPADKPSGDLEYVLHRLAFPKKPPLMKPEDH